jgi:hypothetical protein
MDAKAVNVSSLSFYDGVTFSSGTFSYSTSINLAALPNTSFLYFNKFLFGGAYVWPGQTITSLNYALSCNGTYALAYTNESFGSSGSNINNFYIVSNVSNGSGPYYLTEIGSTGRTLSYFNLLFGGSDGKSSTDAISFGLISGKAGSPCNLFGANQSYTFNLRLSDSSYPVALYRNIQFTFTTTGAGSNSS